MGILNEKERLLQKDMLQEIFGGRLPPSNAADLELVNAFIACFCADESQPVYDTLEVIENFEPEKFLGYIKGAGEPARALGAAARAASYAGGGLEANVAFCVKVWSLRDALRMGAFMSAAC